MKKILMSIALCAAALLIPGCDLLTTTDNGSSSGGNNGGSGNTYRDKWYNLVNEDAHELQVDRESATYGTHTYSVSGSISFDFDLPYDPEITAHVTFSNIPSGFTEFKAVYEGFLGKSIHGTIAMIPMALEIFGRDPETGKKCLQVLCKDDDAVNAITRILVTKFPSSEAQEKDSYMQRYLPAASLAGANYKNAYAPSEPYTVESGASPNKPQEITQFAYGTVYYTYLFSDGWETTTRQVDIFLPEDETLYKVQGCASCYSQCKIMSKGPWAGLK